MPSRKAKNGTSDKKFSYLEDEDFVDIKVKIPRKTWLHIKELAKNNHRPAAAQLRMYLRAGMNGGSMV